MVIEVLKISVLAVGVVMPLLFSTKRENKIRLPKNYKDTSRAQYAINDHGYLERIHNDDLSSHTL
jgi:hypothetical protein